MTPPRPTRADFKPAPIEAEAEPAQEPEPWEFTDADGEVTAHAFGASWAAAFLAALRDPALGFDRKQGAWETNSPALPRMRAMGEGGVAAADEIHAAMAAAMKAEDERRATAKPEPTDAELDAQAVAEKVIEGVKDQRTIPEVDDYWQGDLRLVEQLPAELATKFREAVEAHRKTIQQPARRAGR